MSLAQAPTQFEDGEKMTGDLIEEEGEGKNFREPAENDTFSSE